MVGLWFEEGSLGPHNFLCVKFVGQLDKSVVWGDEISQNFLSIFQGDSMQCQQQKLIV